MSGIENEKMAAVALALALAKQAAQAAQDMLAQEKRYFDSTRI